MSWCEDDNEDYGLGMSHPSSGKGLTSKPRFSNRELTTLLNEVMRHKDIVLKKYNNGVAANVKKKTWCDITRIVNGLGENQRGVRQIMKKWADLKCDGKRRMMDKRSGTRLPKKCLSRVDRIVEKILLMSPSKKEEEDEGGSSERPPPPLPFSYLTAEDDAPLPLPGGVSFVLSPRSSPDFDYSRDPMRSSPVFESDTPLDEDRSMDRNTIEDSYDGLSPSPFLTPDLLFRPKPGHTYTGTNGPPPSQLPLSTSNSLPPPNSSLLLQSYPCSSLPSPSSSVAPPSSSPPSSFAVPIFPPSSFLTAPHLIPTFAPPASSSSSSSSHSMSVPGPSTPQAPPPYPPSFLPPSKAPHPGSDSSPAGLPQNLHTSRPQNHNRNRQSQSPRDALAQSAVLSLQQQQAGRVLLGAVSRSLEVLAQSVQQLVGSQRQFVRDSLQLQRETVDVLRDFSSAALSMLRTKGDNAAPPP